MKIGIKNLEKSINEVIREHIETIIKRDVHFRRYVYEAVNQIITENYLKSIMKGGKKV